MQAQQHMGNHSTHHLEKVIPPDELPSPDAEKEPMLLLDITGSMNSATSPSDPTPRKDTIREAIGIVVSKLAKHDSQAAHEEWGGGLRTVTFANGKAEDLDDLNPGNLKQKWASIRWYGRTLIMPGWRKILQVYKEEFGKKPASQRPILMCLVITDGEAIDGDEFAESLKRLHGAAYVTVVIIGYGSEHDECLASYKRISESNAHVKVMTLDSESNPEVIASALIKMLE